MNSRKPVILLILIIAGEAIFFLPFVLARIFRPTLLEVFQVTNSELGNWFAIYGLVAMVSYVLGGPLADRFPARKLMAFALALTSLGGLAMASLPTAGIMRWVYVFWGFSTVYLFWAALIRATREWGGDGFQGRAFGWLEGGRGGVAAILGTLAFLIFRGAVTGSGMDVDGSEVMNPFQIVILATSAGTLMAGVLVWIIVPEVKPSIDRLPLKENLKRIRELLRKPTVWMMSGLIICAYSGYKITDDFSLYAREVMGT
jgi:predicted MFS family arabinose efflux permease